VREGVSKLIHVIGDDFIGAVVIDLEEDRVIAASPSLRHTLNYTSLQFNLYTNSRKYKISVDILVNGCDKAI